MILPGAGSERRSILRVLSRQVIELRRMPTGWSRPAVTRDVSAHAVYLYTDEALPEGQQVEIEPLDLPRDGVLHGSPAKHTARVLRIDCIEPDRKYGIALNVDQVDA